MSLPDRIMCKCPKCGRQHEVTVFHSLNTKFSPDIIDKIISNEFFMDVCPKCGAKVGMEYDLLFNDMKHGAMIWVLHDNNDNYEDTVEGIRKTDINLFKYSRIVNSIRDLAEKVTCLEYGVDDRILEIYKLFDADMLESDKPGFIVDKAYYTQKGNMKRMVYKNEEGRIIVCDFNEKLYETLESGFKSELDELGDLSYPVIDGYWAMDFVDQYHAKHIES